MNYHLISSIVKGIWAIDQEAALGYSPLLNNIFGGSPVQFEFEEDQFSPLAVERSTRKYSYYDGWNKAPKGSIALIPLSGPLMKNDQYCGPVGMATIGQIIKEADESPNIDGILLKIDSPGGTVDGTVAMADIVSNTQKPIIAFADGLMASAALWIGAAADEIVAADNRTEIGSVGVLLSFADLQPAYEKIGVKFHSVVADQSKDKTRLWEDIRKGKYDEYKKEVLNPLADDFIAHIKATRPNVKDEQLTGKVFFAQDALGTLVDSIGNIDHAINRLGELINENTKQTSNKNSIQMEKQFLNVNKAIGVESLEATEDGVFLNEEQLGQLDAAIADGASNAGLLESSNTALADAESARDTALAELDTANQTIEAQQAEIDELKKKPGAESAAAVTGKDKELAEKDGNVTKDGKSFTENMQAVADEFLN